MLAPAGISGTVIQCAGLTSNPLANATMTLTGSSSGSTLTDASGNYTFTGLVAGGNYTVTPTKAGRTPGSNNVNTVDVIGIQRHFLNVTLLTGCRLIAGDCAAPAGINTVDVIAVQRFFLGLTTGIGNVGKYGFTPTSRSYTPLTSNQTGQGYDTVVFGDVANPYANPRPGGPAPDVSETSASTVESVALPDVTVDQSRSKLTAEVKSSAIDGKNNLVGFQGDFTFDERVIHFASVPVQKAGLTGGDWTVAGNVMDGPGPIRTLRVSAYSNDFKPLKGEGTLFELRMTRVAVPQTSAPLWSGLRRRTTSSLSTRAFRHRPLAPLPLEGRRQSQRGQARNKCPARATRCWSVGRHTVR